MTFHIDICLYLDHFGSTQGGCVDTQNQSLALLFMVLGPEDVSKVRLGKLSPFTINVCYGSMPVFVPMYILCLCSGLFLCLWRFRVILYCGPACCCRHVFWRSSYLYK